MEKKASIHDIAKLLKVSATTISFVLNGKAEEKRISAKLQKRILDYVEKTGYRPNIVAQSLRTGKTKIIGMLVEDISDPFFSSIARIIEENLYNLGYKIFHSSTNNNTERAKTLIQIFRERQVDGYIIAPTPGLENEIQALLNDSRPLVLFDRYFPGLKTTNVVIDNSEGASTAVKHLFENGYSNIALITLNSNQIQMLDRRKGYHKIVAKNKLEEFILEIEYKTQPEKIVTMIKEFLQKNPIIDAILFATNYLAVSGLHAIKELGLNIPKDVGVVGFDDNTHFSLFSPSITAVAQPVQELSEEVIKQLLKCLSNTDQHYKKETIILKTSLIIRKSSVPKKVNSKPASVEKVVKVA